MECSDIFPKRKVFLRLFYPNIVPHLSEIKTKKAMIIRQLINVSPSFVPDKFTGRQCEHNKTVGLCGEHSYYPTVIVEMIFPVLIINSKITRNAAFCHPVFENRNPEFSKFRKDK